MKKKNCSENKVYYKNLMRYLKKIISPLLLRYKNPMNSMKRQKDTTQKHELSKKKKKRKERKMNSPGR